MLILFDEVFLDAFTIRIYINQIANCNKGT